MTMVAKSCGAAVAEVAANACGNTLLMSMGDATKTIDVRSPLPAARLVPRKKAMPLVALVV